MLHFLFTTCAYAQGTKWKKLLIDWNKYQENTASIGFQVDRPKLNRESFFTHSINYGRLCTELSTKQAIDNFQSRGLLRRIMETLKRSVFPFHYRKFSQQKNSALFYYYRRVTSGMRRRCLCCTFLKVGRKYHDSGKKCPDFGHRWVKFLI